jgi:hypothetical protein
MDEIVVSMAFKIADDAARSDIECHCVARMEDGSEPLETSDHATCWYDSTTIPDPEMRATVEAALLYLVARGMVQWHATRRGWVRPLHSRPMELKYQLH